MSETARSSAALATPVAEVAGVPDPLVALVGPPNSGKSTLFNTLTGLRQRVANYPRRDGRAKVRGRERAPGVG